MLPEVTRRMRPPRALSVPYPLGYPLGEPDAPDLQRDVLRRLLAMIPGEDVPVLEELPAAAARRPTGTS